MRAFIALGANLGDPLAQLRAARRALHKLPETRITGGSAIYRTAPIGPGAQADYLNAVVSIDTDLGAGALLDALQAIEQRAGRRRGERWGARTLDLDLLLYGDRELHTPRLTIPHPQLYRRNFVLLPLADLCPASWRFPDGSRLAERIRQCPPNPIERTPYGWESEAAAAGHSA